LSQGQFSSTVDCLSTHIISKTIGIAPVEIAVFFEKQSGHALLVIVTKSRRTPRKRQGKQISGSFELPPLFEQEQDPKKSSGRAATTQGPRLISSKQPCRRLQM
jgi:hypothetical protein